MTALQGVTLVTRGVDLFASTTSTGCCRRCSASRPALSSSPLLTDASGRRLAKRDQALTIRAMRQVGMTPAEIIAAAGQ
jgi:glutamyl-Q tRNA(Asp) synthetase